MSYQLAPHAYSSSAGGTTAHRPAASRSTDRHDAGTPMQQFQLIGQVMPNGQVIVSEQQLAQARMQSQVGMQSSAYGTPNEFVLSQHGGGLPPQSGPGFLPPLPRQGASRVPQTGVNYGPNEWTGGGEYKSSLRSVGRHTDPPVQIPRTLARAALLPVRVFPFFACSGLIMCRCSVGGLARPRRGCGAEC